MKKVIEQDFFLYIGDIEVSTDSDGDIEVLQWNKGREGGCDIITVGESKAREVALAIDQNLLLDFLKWIHENEYQQIHGDRWVKNFMSFTHSQEELIEIYKQSLNM